MKRIEVIATTDRTEVIIRTQRLSYAFGAIITLLFLIAIALVDLRENGFGPKFLARFALILTLVWIAVWEFLGREIITLSDSRLVHAKKLLPFLPPFRTRVFELRDVRRLRREQHSAKLMLQFDPFYYLAFEYRGTAPILCRELSEAEATALLEGPLRALSGTSHQTSGSTEQAAS